MGSPSQGNTQTSAPSQGKGPSQDNKDYDQGKQYQPVGANNGPMGQNPVQSTQGNYGPQSGKGPQAAPQAAPQVSYDPAYNPAYAQYQNPMSSEQLQQWRAQLPPMQSNTTIGLGSAAMLPPQGQPNATSQLNTLQQLPAQLSPLAQQMGALKESILSSGQPPTADQIAQLQALQQQFISQMPALTPQAQPPIGGQGYISEPPSPYATLPARPPLTPAQMATIGAPPPNVGLMPAQVMPANTMPRPPVMPTPQQRYYGQGLPLPQMRNRNRAGR